MLAVFWFVIVWCCGLVQIDEFWRWCCVGMWCSFVVQIDLILQCGDVEWCCGVVQCGAVPGQW